jgi:ribonuclease VapC
VIIIDTSALIAIFRFEDEADLFLTTIVEADERYFSALNLLEASMVISGRGDGEAAFEPLDEFLTEAGIRIAPFDTEQAGIARDAFLRFGKGRHKAALNLGDCVSYALAKTRNAPLLFKGADFALTDVTPAVPASAP